MAGEAYFEVQKIERLNVIIEKLDNVLEGLELVLTKFYPEEIKKKKEQQKNV